MVYNVPEEGMTPRFYGEKTSFARFKENLSFKEDLMCVLCARSLQSCPTLWDSMDCSQAPSVHGDSPDKNSGVEFAMHSSRGSS